MCRIIFPASTTDLVYVVNRYVKYFGVDKFVEIYNYIHTEHYINHLILERFKVELFIKCELSQFSFALISKTYGVDTYKADARELKSSFELDLYNKIKRAASIGGILNGH